jgi:hypothetical protein
MKKLNIQSASICLMMAVLFSGCYKLQKDYKYVKYTLDPAIGMSAKDFMTSRGKAGVGSDTVFKWMQMGLEYAGIDLSEYEKPGRTFIFLHNSAIKTVGTVNGVKNQINGGFFFDYPIPAFDAAGNLLKSKLNPAADSMRPAVNWSDYPQQMVKNYLLYFIIDGEYGFDNLTINNQSLQTLMPAGQIVSPKDSRLGWVVTKTTPNPDPTSVSSITFSYPTGGSGFDPEGKINLKITNNDQSPITINDRTNDRTAGYIATNGQIHVFGATVHPFRYSW